MAGERFWVKGSGAAGTDKAILNLFRSLATLYTRAWIYEVLLGCAAAPADVACDFVVQRTTAVGTEGSGCTPRNIDPGGPASQSDAGSGVFSAEPTKTADEELLELPMNQRATYKWCANHGAELILPATQNYGACINCEATTGGATTWIGTMFFIE